MSYSVDEWFADSALPVLAKAFEEIKHVKDEDMFSEYDLFFEAFGKVLDIDVNHFSAYSDRREQFCRKLFSVIFNMQNKQITDVIKKCFEYASYEDEQKILSLEYKNGFDKIKCDYNSIPFEEE